jgi:Thioredoxin reductase
MSCDILVIGGGPAGLSAAINARARGKSVLVVSNPAEENPLWKSEKIDNYLGLPGLSGEELLERFRRHAEQSGAEFTEGKVLNTALTGDTWYASVGSDVTEAGAVVLAAGVARGRKFPGEETLIGRGVSYCATCDGMLYRGKAVAVLGFSATAEREAEFLREIGCTVTYFDRPKTCEITGGERVASVTADGVSADVEGVFILRPTVAPADLFPGLAVEKGYISVDRKMATNLPGLFAAGDCTGGPLQVAKAVGEGLVAGQSAAAWIDAHRRTRQTENQEPTNSTIKEN